MATKKEQLPASSLTPARPSSRSRLNAAVKSMNGWSTEDRQIFIACFTTIKSGCQVAHELGISQQTLQQRRREILRRFIHAADTVPAV